MTPKNIKNNNRKRLIFMKKIQQILTLQAGVLENWELEVASLPKQSAQATDGLWSTTVVILKDTSPYTKDGEKAASNKFEKFTVKTAQKPVVELEDRVTVTGVIKAVPYASGGGSFINSLSVTASSLDKVGSTITDAKENGQGIFAKAK